MRDVGPEVPELDRTGFRDGRHDLMALREALEVDWISDTPEKLDAGDACKTAKDQPTCRKKVDELRPTNVPAVSPGLHRN